MITAVITARIVRSFAPTTAISRPTGQKTRKRKAAWPAEKAARNPQLAGGTKVKRNDTAQTSTAPAWNRTSQPAT